MGFDPTQVQSQSQDEIVNAAFCGNFGVRQNFGLHRVDKWGPMALIYQRGADQISGVHQNSRKSCHLRSRPDFDFDLG